MKHICSWCGRIVGTDHVCPNKPKDTRKKQINVDSRWRKIREEVKKRDLVCQLCWYEGAFHKIDEVHHIIPREVRSDDSYVFNADNCIGLCRDHHHQVHNEGWQNYVDLLQQLVHKK